MRVRHSVLLPLFAIMMTSGVTCSGQVWKALGFVDPALARAGDSGGEGAQWPQALAVDSTGEFLLYGTDVGGIFRSLDGGVTWEPANVGFSPRGSCGLEIDPGDGKTVLAVGANSSHVGATPYHGLYRSTDRGATWQQVVPGSETGYRDVRDQIAFDPSTDAGGASQRVYYSALTDGLFRSDDGGESWALVDPAGSGAEIAVRRETGALYLTKGGDLRRSVDGGVSFTTLISGGVTSFALVEGRDQVVFVIRSQQLEVFDEGSLSAVDSRPVPGTGTLRWLSISPADPERMLVVEDAPAAWNRKQYVTTDAGESWQSVVFDNTNAFLPFNRRHSLTRWHPSDARIAWNFGGDWATRSTDGGMTFGWSSQGINGVVIGGPLAFNEHHPDVFYVGAQDYNGAVTQDGGETWRYVNASGFGWGGHAYGAYAASRKLLYVGVATGGWTSPRELRISRDGGRTFQATGQLFGGLDASFGDPTDPRILFASNLRSVDGGLTWAAMSGCDGVLASDPTGPRDLYGASGSAVVRSTDRGQTWVTMCSAPAAAGPVRDVAYDPSRGRIYLATSTRRLFRHEGGQTLEITSTLLPETTVWQQQGAWTVAVDPVDPDIVYVGRASQIYASDASVLRSADAGLTWERLTRLPGQEAEGPDGGREALWVRVHPTTRELFVVGGCYGLWKLETP